MLRSGSLAEVEALDTFLARQPHAHKVIIAGNHDWAFERTPGAARARIRHAVYLEDSAHVIDGVRFWGSPWQPAFQDWAFNLERGESLREKWNAIPTDTDVLITHGPPMGTLDRTLYGDEVGCEELATAVDRVVPRVHLFGHIHERYGRLSRGATEYVNASVCDVRYRPVNTPQVIEL